MKKFYTYLILFLLFTSHSYADQPGSWEPYILESDNKEYFAFIDYADQDSAKHPWERKWQLGVFHKDSTLFWKREFNPTGYKEGNLTNDGENIVMVSFWYYKKGWVVSVLNKEPKNDFFLTGNQFKIQDKYLIETTSHFLWREDYKIEDNKILITTNDGNKWEVNIPKKELSLIHSQNSSALNIILISVFLVFVSLCVFLYLRKRNFQS